MLYGILDGVLGQKEDISVRTGDMGTRPEVGFKEQNEGESSSNFKVWSGPLSSQGRACGGHSWG